MTERDDFLREHLSPPADSDDEPAGRPQEMPPSTPPPAGQDDTPPHNPVDDAPRPTGPDNDGSRVPKTPTAGHPTSRGDRQAPTIARDASPGRPIRAGPRPGRSVYRPAATAKGRHPRAQPSWGTPLASWGPTLELPSQAVNPVPRVVMRAGTGNPRRRSPPG